jgi:mRNA interferase YafQ
MRTIEWTNAFKRDFKKTLTTPRHRDIGGLLEQIATQLANDLALPEKHRDHALSGNWTDHRECHIKPDLLLIYKKPDAATLRMVRLGSHAICFDDFGSC